MERGPGARPAQPSQYGFGIGSTYEGLRDIYLYIHTVENGAIADPSRGLGSRSVLDAPTPTAMRSMG